MKQDLIVMCGLPRSGKSTYIDEHFANFQIICADDIRLALGTQFEPMLEAHVWAIHDTMIRAAMERYKPIVIDGTNTTPATYKKYSSMAVEYNYSIRVFMLMTSIEKCLERNHGKGAVPEGVIRRMARQLADLSEDRLFSRLSKKLIN